MNERITLVSLFNQNNLKKIQNSLQVIDEPLCKVPFGKNVNNRFQADTLPSHFTFSSWNIKHENFILQELSKISFEKFNILVDKIDIMNGAENSYVLYFHIAANESLRKLHEKIYNILPSKFYDPSHFQFHITITIDKDFQKISYFKKKLEKNFSPFELEVDKIGLFEIYPAKLVHDIGCVR